MIFKINNLLKRGRLEIIMQSVANRTIGLGRERRDFSKLIGRYFEVDEQELAGYKNGVVERISRLESRAISGVRPYLPKQKLGNLHSLEGLENLYFGTKVIETASLLYAGIFIECVGYSIANANYSGMVGSAIGIYLSLASALTSRFTRGRVDKIIKRKKRLKGKDLRTKK